MPTARVSLVQSNWDHLPKGIYFNRICVQSSIFSPDQRWGLFYWSSWALSVPELQNTTIRKHFSNSPIQPAMNSGLIRRVQVSCTVVIFVRLISSCFAEPIEVNTSIQVIHFGPVDEQKSVLLCFPFNQRCNLIFYSNSLQCWTYISLGTTIGLVSMILCFIWMLIGVCWNESGVLMFAFRTAIHCAAISWPITAMARWSASFPAMAVLVFLNGTRLKTVVNCR